MISVFHHDVSCVQVSRVRIELRLLGQMLVLGIITDQKEGFTLLHNTLCKIVENDKVCKT